MNFPQEFSIAEGYARAISAPWRVQIAIAPTFVSGQNAVLYFPGADNQRYVAALPGTMRYIILFLFYYRAM